MSTVAVVGLGYVGLPLAVEFGKKRKTIGFDLSHAKVESYRRFVDPTGEVSSEDLRAAAQLTVSTDPASLAEADFIIVAVPTPVDAAHQPDFGPLAGASESVGRHMKRGAIVVYESTVYPGATEEVCVPILEKFSGMRWRQDFHVGYSPERINPGDKEHTLTRILKVVSGDDAETLENVAALYQSIITAGIFRASSIKVAEAAKVIENTQRDLNIALMNELAILFDRMGIDTLEVLQAAGTKWNFLPFRPGLVGGHCIGVDPYYLTHKADKIGYHPQVILAGRRINDGMGKFIAEQTVKHVIHNGSPDQGGAGQRAGADFQGGLSGYSQYAGYRRDPGVEVLWYGRPRARSGARRRGSAPRIRSRTRAMGCIAARRCRRGGSRASAVRREAALRIPGEGGRERLFHRRQEQVRHDGLAAGGTHGLAVVMALAAGRERARWGLFAPSGSAQ